MGDKTTINRITVSGKRAVGNGYEGKSVKHATSEYLAQFGTKCVSYLSSDTGAHTKVPYLNTLTRHSHPQRLFC